MRRLLCAAATLVALTLLVAGNSLVCTAESPSGAADPALARARETVRMLDDLYKTAVVLITEHYVTEESSLPAGTAALALFDAMKKKGWHEVRLLDATGQPIEDKNSPQDDFEKEAIKQLLTGESSFERVETRDGKRFLRTATAVPVVMQKCTMCHEHYSQVPAGQAIGSLSYTLEIK